MASLPRLPQLVSFGFDDNAYADGIDWALAMMRRRRNADGTAIHASFFVAAMYLDSAGVARALRDALAGGHEIGDHTFSHAHGGAFSVAQWHEEVRACMDAIARTFDSHAAVRGFRAPFLEWNDAAFEAVRALGLDYDSSVEDGWDAAQSGATYSWPWRRDDGLWTLPVHPVIVPPELRARLAQHTPDFDAASGKITGFDYNLWVLHEMTPGEVMATLAHTLDLRIAGNRAPLCIGMHSDLYSRDYALPMRATLAERRLAIEEFLDYALSKPDVRMVSHAQILDYVNGPTLLP